MIRGYYAMPDGQATGQISVVAFQIPNGVAQAFSLFDWAQLFQIMCLEIR